MRVSVVVITYNHREFIAAALDGALAQVTDFAFEIVVTDDCSADGTAEIVQEYARRHPGIVRAHVNERNIGAHENWKATMARARGDYLAFLDGDDYWSDPDKLATQVEFLDAHPEYALAFHPVEVLSPSGDRKLLHPPGRRPRYDFGDLMKLPLMATPSVMCRRGTDVRWPDWYDESTMPGDWVLWSLHARHGDIGYIDRPMAVYRQHPGGIYTSSPHERLHRLSIYEVPRRLNEDFGGHHTWRIRRATAALRLKIAVARFLPAAVGPLVALRDRVTARRVRRRT